MASVSSSWAVPMTKSPHFTPTQKAYLHFPQSISSKPPNPSGKRPFLLVSKSANSPVAERKGEEEKEDEEPMSIDNLHRFIQLNLGTWNGSFNQYDSHGRLLQNVTTKLAVSSYGEDELISLLQTLYIKEPPSTTSISGYDPEPEWAEYKIKETNMFTVDKYQQFADWLFS